MNTINKILDTGIQKLKKGNLPSSILDAELILSNILSIQKEDLILEKKIIVSNKDVQKFYRLINRRLKKEPIAYVLNKKEFWNENFYVNKNTLIPRPETELMVEKLINYLKGKNLRILDIGTGSGCIIISILKELKKSKGVGLDINPKALSIAKFNSINCKLSNRLKLVNRSIDNYNATKFDIIVSNPPYIERNQIKNLMDDIKYYEPKLALDGGNDGLDVIKKVIYKSRTILKNKGLLAIEIGKGQNKKVSQILRKNKFREKFLIKDYQNNVRCILSILNM